jgi:hypothetical protein
MGVSLLIRMESYDGRVVARVQTGFGGQFAADLSPGRYWIGPAVVSTMGPDPKNFRVAPGRCADITLVALAP